MLPPLLLLYLLLLLMHRHCSRARGWKIAELRVRDEDERNKEREREREGENRTIPHFVCKACNILWAATEVFGRELKSKINWYILKLRRTGRNGVFTFWPMRQFYTVHWHLNRTKQEQEEHKLMTTRANESRIKITQKWRPRSEIPLLFIVSMP